ncbi:hypothetical protein [Actinomycetospora flava]|uniref:Antibiotic biosynthesis monooxygenase n=1 Tax=Actinomycetospora flava TaxID=3129232 RepID=A0ABU8LY05_9PSEU
MSYILIATPPVQTVEAFDAVSATAGEGEGMEGRWCGQAADGSLRVVTLWTSREHAERFLAERLGPAFARVLGPDVAGRPEATGLEVLRSWTAVPVA